MIHTNAASLGISFLKTLVWIFVLVAPFTPLSNGILLAFLVSTGLCLFRMISGLVPALVGYIPSLSKAMPAQAVLFENSKVSAAVLALVLLLPLFLNSYYIDILSNVGIYILLACGLNIVIGLAGLLDLGFVSFYAIGAYSYALLSTNWGLPFWPAVPIGGLIAAIFGVCLGIVTMRLKGDYLAIVTLGFLQIVNLVAKNWDAVTNGPNGIMNIPMPSIAGFELYRPIHFYYLNLGFVVLAVFTISRFAKGRIGRALVAIREDEIAAGSMGVDVVASKILAFAMGAFWGGLAGVIFAAKYAFISPESFTFFESIIVLCMVVLGGMGTMTGPILGAFIIVLLPEFLRGLADYRMLIFGLSLVLMMIFRPQGLLGTSRSRVEFEHEAN